MDGRPTKVELETKSFLPPTSFPVEASMSKNMSTRPLTSLAAFALLTDPRNGRVNLIKPASSRIKEEFSSRKEQIIKTQWNYMYFKKQFLKQRGKPTVKPET